MLHKNKIKYINSSKYILNVVLAGLVLSMVVYKFFQKKIEIHNAPFNCLPTEDSQSLSTLSANSPPSVRTRKN